MIVIVIAVIIYISYLYMYIPYRASIYIYIYIYIYTICYIVFSNFLLFYCYCYCYCGCIFIDQKQSYLPYIHTIPTLLCMVHNITADAAWEAQSTSDTFRHLLMSRRTVNGFDPNHPVSDEVLKRAVECAIAAPNRSGSEPWRFIKVGPDTVEKLQTLNARVIMAGGDKVISRQQSKPLLPDVWTEIPGWCVVTSLRSPDDPETELKDFRSTSCAMQNFMLSMWSEGVGSKWTEGPTQKTQQFADLVGIDTDTEKVVGILWYGFPSEVRCCARCWLVDTLSCCY